MKYFQIEEFDSPGEPGSGVKMDAHFLDLLDKLREAAGVPFKINSGYRSPKHNKAVGGKPDSAHTRGLAADIAAPTSHERYKILEAAFLYKVHRIGIGKRFIHVDIDSSLPPEVVWLY